ncbi:MAG: hypothetical protein M3Y73_20180 [Actinomycetota bacterium]|nr:hypothetical protein [Actinomycetota bacterium]
MSKNDMIINHVLIVVWTDQVQRWMRWAGGRRGGEAACTARHARLHLAGAD